MIITSQYTVDIIHLNKTDDKKALLEFYESKAGVRIGTLIIKNFPSVKDEIKSFKGELINRYQTTQPPVDYYRNEIFVSTVEFMENLYNTCNHIFDPLLKSEICNLIKDEMRKTIK